MAYMEKDKLDTLCQKLENTCEENHLSYKLVTRDPISIVIRPDMTMEGQITMLDNPTGYNGKDSSLTIFFSDAGVEYKFTGGFAISKQLLNKLLNMAQKIHYMYLWVFFRDETERRRLIAGGAPGADEPTETDDVPFPWDDGDPFDGVDEE